MCPFQICEGNPATYLEIDPKDPAIKCFQYAKWFNFPAQLLFYVNMRYWISNPKLLVRPNEALTGFTIVILGSEINWKTECILFRYLD